LNNKHTFSLYGGIIVKINIKECLDNVYTSKMTTLEHGLQKIANIVDMQNKTITLLTNSINLTTKKNSDLSDSVVSLSSTVVSLSATIVSMEERIQQLENLMEKQSLELP
jgi:septal ring factor EnvC (AmiA/AmiB activator)